VSNRYADYVTRLRQAVLAGPGVTPHELRQAAEKRSAALGGRPNPDVAGPPPPLPAALSPFVDTVARRAFEVTDRDVAALRAAGYSEDAIFEIVASVAVGAGLGRLERGLAALRGEC
jgi:alkylhydroperoxidase family enzyme